MANFSKPQSTEIKSQRIADTNYVAARVWSKSGRQHLETGLKEMRANNTSFAMARMKEALLHFDKATKAYDRAHDATDSLQMQGKFRRKAIMLRNSDVACAVKALRRMEPKAELPMDDVRR